jgi:hypothetical protein
MRVPCYETRDYESWRVKYEVSYTFKCQHFYTIRPRDWLTLEKVTLRHLTVSSLRFQIGLFVCGLLTTRFQLLRLHSIEC